MEIKEVKCQNSKFTNRTYTACRDTNVLWIQTEKHKTKYEVVGHFIFVIKTLLVSKEISKY
jgi:hypothetical protein